MRAKGPNWRLVRAPRKPSGYSRACYVKVHGDTRTKTFDYPETPESEWKGWIAEMKAEGAKPKPKPSTVTTFGADAADWLVLRPEGRRRERDAELIRCWSIDAGFGPRPRGSITQREVREWLMRWALERPKRYRENGELVHGWKSDGYALDTRKKLLAVLRLIWEHCDGADAPNPARGIKLERAQDPPDRWFDDSLRDAILAELEPGCATEIRLRLIAAFGLRHSEVMRLAETDFDFESRRNPYPSVKIRRPEGSKLGVERTLAMDDDGIDAARDFIAAGLCGQEFSQSAMHSAFKRAVERARARGFAVPFDDMTPYDLRHKKAGNLRRQGWKIEDIAAYLGHRPGSKVTYRYAQTVWDNIAAQVLKANQA